MVVEAVIGVMSLEDGSKVQKLRRTMKLIFSAQCCYLILSPEDLFVTPEFYKLNKYVLF